MVISLALPVRRQYKQHLKDLSELVNLSLESAKIDRLILEEPARTFIIRSQLHLLLRAPVGQLKSTILNEIGDKLGIPVITEITHAGMVGAFDNKTSMFIPGYAWQCRNSLLLLDEWNPVSRRNEEKGHSDFLQLMETGKYVKKVGLFSISDSKKDEKTPELYYSINNGLIDLRTRFSVIIATMRNFEIITGQEFKALLTRCVPYELLMTNEELDYIAQGYPLVNIKQSNVERSNHTVKLSDYNRIRKFVWNSYEKSERWKDKTLRANNYLRLIGDLCRIFAMKGKHDKKLYELVFTTKNEIYDKLGIAREPKFGVSKMVGVGED